MECVEAALKTSFRKDMAIRFSPQAFFDDLCTLNMQNVTSSDDFIVDELLDFSNEEQQLIVIDDDNQQKSCATVSTSLSASPTQQEQPHEDDKISQNLSNFASELCVPVEDLASLEWLSHFVEDSNSEYCAPFPAGLSHQKTSTAEDVKKNGNGENDMTFYVPQKVVSRHAVFKTPVPAKARSKRSRTGLRVWPLGSPSLTPESSSSSSSCSSCSFSSSSPSSPRHLAFTAQGLTSEPFGPAGFEKPLVKKPKRRFSGESGTGGGGSQPARRCSHCGVQKTPQWRAGPLGAKTLCNACGVRFKSGRLFPEYRPACSPTFSSELHSNHHRKVLEMRKKKEVLVQAEPGLIHPTVPSF